MKTISVLVPIYNSSKYLEKCLNSLVTQEIQFHEIICIDDCSTDNSVNIVKEFQRKYNNIILKSTNVNSGPAIARNIGLDIATGDYIYFVDSDDVLKKNFSKNIYPLLDLNVDLIRININVLYTFRAVKVEDWRNFKYDGIIDNKTFFTNFPDGHIETVYSFVVSKKLIDKNNLRFNEKLFFHEDYFFVIQCITFAKQIYFLNKRLYVHYINNYNMSSNTSLDYLEVQSRRNLFYFIIDWSLQNKSLLIDTNFLTKFLIETYDLFKNRIKYEKINEQEKEKVKNEIRNLCNKYLKGDVDEML